jgi:rRNA maturation endonuclease Nob1
MTVEECPKCGVKLKRSFRDGDYVGKEGEVCEFCGSRMHVRMIFIEPVSPAR